MTKVLFLFLLVADFDPGGIWHAMYAQAVWVNDRSGVQTKNVLLKCRYLLLRSRRVRGLLFFFFPIRNLNKRHLHRRAAYTFTLLCGVLSGRLIEREW